MDESTTNIQVGNRLFELRKNMSLKQIDVANCLDISTSAYSRIERGECSSTVRELTQLSIFFNVTVNWILGIDEDSNLTTKENLELTNYKQYLVFKRNRKK